MTSVERTSI